MIKYYFLKNIICSFKSYSCWLLNFDWLPFVMLSDPLKFYLIEN